MSATQTTFEHDQSHSPSCTRCQMVLPPHATFCGNCGERVAQPGDQPQPGKKSDITEYYRITSLVRRRPYRQIFRALDTQRHRSVLIHDIDISELDARARTQAIESVQSEYDLLRRQSIVGVLPLIDLLTTQEHLYLVSGWPAASDQQEQAPQIHTLDELLQSGLGLPGDQKALSWIDHLCRALAPLHRQQIILEDLDPQTIILNEHTYTGQPALLVSWLPEQIRAVLTKALNNIDTANFTAPEARVGRADPRSDIYSLGAVLYLLLTGIPPLEPAARLQEALPSPRSLNPRINSDIDALVMRSLELHVYDRFESTEELSAALMRLYTDPSAPRPLPPFSNRPAKPVVKARTVRNEREGTSASPIYNETKIDDHKEVSASAADADDVTISVVPLQAQMARRYLSRIKTGKLGTQEESTGETVVKERSSTIHTGEEAGAGSTTNISTAPSGADSETHEQEGSPDTRHEAGAATAVQTPETFVDDVAPLRTEDLLVELPAASENAGANADNAHVRLEDSADVQTEASATQEEGEATLTTEALPASADVPAVETAVPTTSGETHEHETTHPLPATVDDSADHADQKENPMARLKNLVTSPLAAVRLNHPKELTTPNDVAPAGEASKEKEESLLKRMQRFLLGEQQHGTQAAALIETPLRILPNQSYSIRINVMGRNEPKKESAGLGGMVEGDIVHIEVRSALYQNYAYIVQQADVQIPAAGYVAEVTMPMQRLASGPGGRHERLHIFFMDAMRNPLYEKPFVMELFISHLVQSGREGRNVLSIPL